LIVEGYNDFPDGVIETDVRRERPTKYLYTEHAERAALYKALRTGVDLTRYMIAVTQYPCADCARGIILSGIELVVVPAGSVVPTFKESSNAARKMFAECGVEVIEI
jgi:dCMP deaminase